MCGILLPAVAASLLLVPSGHGAMLDQALTQRLAAAGTDEPVLVLVYVRDAVDLEREWPQLTYGQSRLDTRHQLVVSALQERARQTQQALVRMLDEAATRGQAQRIHTYWLDNMIGLEARPELIHRLSQHPDVERIALVPDVTIDPPARAVPRADATGHESSLDAIGAPTMWAQGYTGKGRLICGVDTGVRGTHLALQDRWRGNRAPVEQCWYDASGQFSAPTDAGVPQGHGTHTIGTTCGADTVLGDTIGVAIEAEWIAAYAVSPVSITTLELIGALEWAADPDGNPNTMDDVPDVVNCSWRFNTVSPTPLVYPCNDIIDQALDNLEAAGVFVSWSAGNEGPATSSIGNPSNKMNAFSTNFAVGAFDHTGDLIWGGSSRGPSPCPGDSIKPEVVAPGVNIRSSFYNGDNSYVALTGTSMAAPHVSGAVAILRQTAPGATPAQIKQALMVSAIDKGAAGEDNTYGFGLINIPAAADSLSALMGGPDLRVITEQVTVAAGLATGAVGQGDSLHAGDTVSLVFEIHNRATAAATSAWVRLTESDPFVTLVVDSVGLGTVAGEDTVTSTALRFVISGTAPKGQPLAIDLEFGTATGYLASRPLQYYTDPAPFPAQFNHDNTLVSFTVTNFGLQGMADLSYYPRGGFGFLYDPSTYNALAAMAFMLAVSPTQVSDAVRSGGGAEAGLQIFDADFAVAPGGALLQDTNIGGAFQTTICRFDDRNAETPIGIRVTQRSLIFPRGLDEGYVLLIYTLQNTSGGGITGLHVGMLHDWGWGALGFLGGRDSTGTDLGRNLTYMFDRDFPAAGPYRGVSVVSSPGVTSYKALDGDVDFFNPASYEVITTDSAKWQFLSNGIGPPAVGTGVNGDAGICVGTGPFDLASGDTVQVAFAVLGSEEGLTRLRINADAAQVRYDSLYVTSPVTDEPVRPQSVELYPNFPNPFNPTTRIDFTLGRPERVQLTVFNLLGQTVTTLVDGTRPAGRYRIDWDGTDRRGAPVASGVYFYRLVAGGVVRTRKMLLLR